MRILKQLFRKIKANNTEDEFKNIGHIKSIQGAEIICAGLKVSMGEICTIRNKRSKTNIKAEVVGIDGDNSKLSLYGDVHGIESGASVEPSGKTLEIPVGNSLIGRVINSTGMPVDGKGEIKAETYKSVNGNNITAENVRKNDHHITTGIRAIDGLFHIAAGNSIGILAESGTGKSTLINMIAKSNNADLNVICLIGERCLELSDYVKQGLGEDVMKRTVIIAETSSSPAICRFRAAFSAFAVAEFLRDQGKNVMFMMDSVTRFSQAQREISLMNHGTEDEPYPNTVMEFFSKICERSCCSGYGTITSLFVASVEDGDVKNPVINLMKAMLDGYFVLSRELAQRMHFPAIDILKSSYGGMQENVEIKIAQTYLRRLLELYDAVKDSYFSGAYKKGVSCVIDEAIEKYKAIEAFLKQEENEKADYTDSVQKLLEITGVIYEKR